MNDEEIIKLSKTEEQLVKLVHKLKCCGNCRYRTLGILYSCSKRKIACLERGSCSEWVIELAE